jgi:toxin ParE1/3/4
MTPQLLVRPQARRDLADIADYIALDNLDAADRFLSESYRAFHNLAHMPHIGSGRRFRRKGLYNIRLWRIPHFEKYLVIYKPMNNGAEIVRVLHGSRDIERLLTQ